MQKGPRAQLKKGDLPVAVSKPCGQVSQWGSAYGVKVQLRKLNSRELPPISDLNSTQRSVSRDSECSEQPLQLNPRCLTRH